MNAALEILGFSKFLKALFSYGTYMYHCASKDKKEKKQTYGFKSFYSSSTANVNLFLANVIG